MFSPWNKDPEPGQCQMFVEDFERGQRYNLRRVFVRPLIRPCMFAAKGHSKDGQHLCNRHLKKAEAS